MKTQVLSETQRKNMLRLLSIAVFLVFFQGYMVAPLLPNLAKIFAVPVQTIALTIPAYFMAYGAVTLLYGPLSDRIGRLPVICMSLAAFALLSGVTASAQSPAQLIWIRLLAGLAAGGITPISVGLVGDLFPYERRGQALGLIFGAVAGGMACGSAAGSLLEPVIGWRGLFLLVSAVAGVLAISVASFRKAAITTSGPAVANTGNLFRSVREILRSGRARRTYLYIILFGLFQSGVYTWLSLLFEERYRLGDVGIGLALLGYGIPGWLFGSAIGRASDRWGRNRLIPAGIALSGLATLALSYDIPVAAAAAVVTALSLGCDMTQPALAAIATDLSPKRGLAIGLFAFSLFTGFGLGSLVFGGMLGLGLPKTFFIFGLIAIAGAFCAGVQFRKEGVLNAANAARA